MSLRSRLSRLVLGPAPRFCSGCGLELIAGIDTSEREYDTATGVGHKWERPFVSCPNLSTYRRHTIAYTGPRRKVPA